MGVNLWGKEKTNRWRTWRCSFQMERIVEVTAGCYLEDMEYERKADKGIVKKESKQKK